MMTLKSKAQKESNLAEKCRLALEKSYGMPVPEPKGLLKNHSLFTK